jgi:hypothetical protein
MHRFGQSSTATAPCPPTWFHQTVLNRSIYHGGWKATKDLGDDEHGHNHASRTKGLAK